MTQDNGHTAGPWFPVFNGLYWDISVGPEAFSQSVGSCHQNRPLGMTEYTAAANARLIAAAPEQFGIIKDLIEWVDRFTGTLPEAQSDALFDLYRRARSTYRNVDQAAHDASRKSVILQARGGAG